MIPNEDAIVEDIAMTSLRPQLIASQDTNSTAKTWCVKMITLAVALANEKRCCNVSNILVCVYIWYCKFVCMLLCIYDCTHVYIQIWQCYTVFCWGKILINKSFADRVADMLSLIRRSPVEGSFVSRRCGHDSACNKAGRF